MARVYRFFIEGVDSDLGKDFSLVPGRADDILNQLTKVLRVQKGDRVVLLSMSNVFGNEDFEYEYDVQTANKKEVGLKFLGRRLCKNELETALELVLCLPNKPDKLSFILQKAVELGVSKVVLVEGDNSQMKHDLKYERLVRVMKEAAEQSERAYIPLLEIEGKMREYLSGVGVGEVFIAMERDDGKGPEFGRSNASLKVVIGPEGGFSEEEKKFIRNKKFSTFSLGRRILRMETAAIVAMGLASLR